MMMLAKSWVAVDDAMTVLSMKCRLLIDLAATLVSKIPMSGAAVVPTEWTEALAIWMFGSGALVVVGAVFMSFVRMTVVVVTMFIL